MKKLKTIGAVSAIVTVAATGVAVYTKIKANKIKMDDMIESEIADETVEPIEKVSKSAAKVALVAGVVCAMSVVASILNKKSATSPVPVPMSLDKEELMAGFVDMLKEYTEEVNTDFVKGMTDHDIDMHGLTGTEIIDDVIDVYQDRYMYFVNTYATGEEFKKDLGEVLNIHSVFVRDDFADSLVGGKLYA